MNDSSGVIYIPIVTQLPPSSFFSLLADITADDGEVWNSFDENYNFNLLCTSLVGGIAVITRLFDGTGPVAKPCITILVAPVFSP
jgi:hypothetical protein